jgi:signal transduction histidine kinase
MNHEPDLEAQHPPTQPGGGPPRPAPESGREYADALLSSYVNGLPRGISIRRNVGGYDFVNARLRALDAHGSEDALGDFLGTEALKLLRECDEKVVTSRQSVEIDLPVKLGGRDLVMRVFKFPMAVGSQQVSHVGTFIDDVTEQRRLEAEEKQSAQRLQKLHSEQRNFIATLSHEFRTPLTAIEGANYLLQKKLEPAEMAPLADFTRLLRLQKEALGKLRSLVDQVLMLNRVESLNAEVAMAAVEVAVLAARVAETFNQTMEKPRVEVVAGVPVDWTVPGNDSLIRDALENLISNGLKYSAAEHPVKVQILRTEAEWQLVVSDRGRGISTEDQCKLATPFFRCANVANVPGAGLGLAIVKRVVELHGGHVVCESALGAGTRFALHFPLRQRSNETLP